MTPTTPKLSERTHWMILGNDPVAPAVVVVGFVEGTRTEAKRTAAKRLIVEPQCEDVTDCGYIDLMSSTLANDVYQWVRKRMPESEARDVARQLGKQMLELLKPQTE